MTRHSSWSSPPVMLALRSDEVHIWRALLDQTPVVPGPEKTALSTEEMARADRFSFDHDRDRFITGRRILREILAKYLRRSPANVSFSYDLTGKPRLCLDDSDPPIRFNLAHSDGLAVYAFSLDREIGVDIEEVRDGLSINEIANQFFSQMEISEFRTVSKDKQNEGFFLWWTRKEAYLKALGGGLSIPLNGFDVSLTPGNPAQLRSSDSPRWTLKSFLPHSSYAGAVVVEGKRLDLKYWNYTDIRDMSNES